MNSDRGIPPLTVAIGEGGARLQYDRGPERHVGFPVTLDLPGGSTTILFPNPPLLDGFDPSAIGIAMLDGLGRVRRTWGLADNAPPLQSGKPLFDGPLVALAGAAIKGEMGTLYHDGYRYSSGGGADAPFLLVVNAQEERQARLQADRSWRMANALRRFGKALTMNPTVRPLCAAAAHEIASSTELAATLLWVHHSEARVLDLVASVGVNRQGTHALTRLALDNPGGSAAELVAASRKEFFLPHVRDHLLTENLEARFCYLRPGGLAILPLLIADRLVGVIEMVGRDGDSNFDDSRELFQTLAEHLALALNSAQMFENFERLASHDPLTGIANHRAMQEFLHLRLAEAERVSQTVGVIMIDVDHFRAFNEEEGHDVGDEVLRRVANSIRVCLRPYDLAARYGGEEFTVVMPGSTLDSLQAAAERIRSRVEAVQVRTPSGRLRHVTVSLGCAIYPENADDAPSLLRAADLALYRAKRSGRNRTVLFDGAYAGERRDVGVPLEPFDAWMSEEDRVLAEARVRRFAPVFNRLAFPLGLSAAQRSILDAMAYAVDVYQEATKDPERRRRLERAEEFRVILPNLDALGERFDQKGERISLLARILAVVLARDLGEAPELDLGRYDPEIVTLTRTERRAA